MERDCVIWSNEHRAWWRANGGGYTQNVERAGRYTRDDALMISFKARDGWDRGNPPTELVVRIQDLPGWAQASLHQPETV